MDPVVHTSRTTNQGGTVRLRPNQFREFVPRLIDDNGDEVTGLAQSEHDFIAQQPAGARVKLTRTMTASDPEAEPCDSPVTRHIPDIHAARECLIQALSNRDPEEREDSVRTAVQYLHLQPTEEQP